MIDEISEYRRLIGEKEYARQLNIVRCKSQRMKGKRNSGLSYSNSSETLQRIKEKYKNGVSDKTILEMLS